MPPAAPRGRRGAPRWRCWQEQPRARPRALRRRARRDLALSRGGAWTTAPHAPAFDALPFAEALGARCVALRDRGRRLLLVDRRPLRSADCQAWADERLSARFSWRLAHPADLVRVPRAARGDAAGARWAAVQRRAGGGARSAPAEDLSLKSISEDTSPVVKLVHSTLYDALKAGASDIHLETHRERPGDQVPRRRRADARSAACRALRHGRAGRSRASR